MKIIKNALLIFLIFISLFIVTGCGKKKELTESDKSINSIVEKAKNLKYESVDVSQRYSDDEDIDNVAVVSKKNEDGSIGTVAVTIYYLKDVAVAKETISFYNSKYNELKNDSNILVTVDKDGYSALEYYDDQKYVYVYSKDKLFVETEVNIQYKDEIITMLKDLDYYKIK